jgi:hypothetical protein
MNGRRTALELGSFWQVGAALDLARPKGRRVGTPAL